MNSNISNKIGVVIVNFNRGKLVSEIAEKLSKYISLSFIVVVDNHSTDNSFEILCKIENAKIKTIFVESNVGYAQGNNLGLKYLKENEGCDFCFVVNPDVYFEEKVIIEILNAFKQNPDYGVITSARIDPLTIVPQIQYSIRVFDTFWLQFLSYFNVARHYILLKRYGVYHYDKSEKEIIQIAVAPGSFLGIRMNAFPDSEVFDEGTFLYGEEDLLAMRCRQLGIKEGFLSNVVYEHRHIQYSTTLSKKSIVPFKHALKSKRYFQKKYIKLTFLQRFLISIAEKVSIAERYLILKVK